MGYRKEAKVFRLVWDESTDYPGMEVRAKSVPLGQFLKISKLAGKSGTDFDPGDIEALFEMFAKALVSWNLEEEDGTPVPATPAGMYDQDMGFVLAVIMKWMAVVTQVSDDLGKGSAAGVRYPEGSIPMEPLLSDRPRLIAQ